MDIQSSLAARSYAASRSAAKPVATPDGASLFGESVRTFAETVQNGEDAALAAMSGKADPHSLVRALAQTELAVETAVTVRNKVVEAYQEILRMPV